MTTVTLALLVSALSPTPPSWTLFPNKALSLSLSLSPKTNPQDQPGLARHGTVTTALVYVGNNITQKRRRCINYKAESCGKNNKGSTKRFLIHIPRSYPAGIPLLEARGKRATQWEQQVSGANKQAAGVGAHDPSLLPATTCDICLPNNHPPPDGRILPAFSAPRVLHAHAHQHPHSHALCSIRQRTSARDYRTPTLYPCHLPTKCRLCPSPPPRSATGLGHRMAGRIGTQAADLTSKACKDCMRVSAAAESAQGNALRASVTASTQASRSRRTRQA